MGEQVVIFGGTFNPVHVGHLIVARSIAERLGAQRVLLMPTATPPHKNAPAASAADRLAMLQLATAGDSLFEISPIELEREGASYTVDTLAGLRSRYVDEAELIWVIGMDMLAELDRWRRADEVVRLARIVTAARPPMPTDIDATLARLAKSLGPDVASQLRRDILPTPLIDLSSTDIRGRIAAGLSIHYMTPPAVVDYIASHGLYRCDSPKR